MAEHKNQVRPYGEDINTGTTDSVLASMFRTILFDLGITPSRFDRLLDRYITDARLPNIKEASSLKGNLRKELMKTSMSWKVFVKALVFLNIKKFEIEIRLTHGHAAIGDTIHRKIIVLDNYSETLGKGDEDE